MNLSPILSVWHSIVASSHSEMTLEYLRLAQEEVLLNVKARIEAAKAARAKPAAASSSNSPVSVSSNTSAVRGGIAPQRQHDNRPVRAVSPVSAPDVMGSDAPRQAAPLAVDGEQMKMDFQPLI